MKKLVPALICLFLVISSQARTITVDDDGPADYNNIQAAINDSNNGDIIEVQPGIYTGDGNRDIDFNGLAITVQSTDPYDPCVVAATIIDCNGTEAEPHRGFIFHDDEDANSVLAGFTITNGYGPYEIEAYGYCGGAIYCSTSSPTIAHCTLSGNSAEDGGGIFSLESSPIIKNCIINDNKAYQPMFGSGGGIYCYGGSPTITNCIIYTNTARSLEGGGGGGICCHYSNNATITNCIITENAATTGGGIYCNVGMMGIGFNDVIITNCTFSANTATYGGAVRIDEGSNPCMVNCILWGDNAIYGPEISMTTIDWGSRLSISFSNVEGGQAAVYDVDDLDWGPGNIDTDPCFVELGYWEDPCNTPTYPWDDFWIDGDYHLLPGSPCIDAGDNNAVPADATDLDGDGNTTEPIPFDLDGNPRFVDYPNVPDTGNGTPPIVDMGAYELFHAIEVPMKFTPQALNPGSKGKWVKAHFVLPEGFAVEDVDTDSPAKIIEPFDPALESEYMNVFVNEEGLVEIEAAFDRGEFCGNGPVEGTIKVIGLLTSGQYFCGTDTIKIINNSFEYLAVLASHWLQTDCGSPDWCGGLDVDQDSAVNFVDFALFDGCCIEFIEE